MKRSKGSFGPETAFMSASDSMLKTRQVATALGVSVSTIKRWADSGELRASRTVGKHRLIRLSEALRLARDRGLPHGNLESLAGLGLVHLDSIDDRFRGSLLAMLREGRTQEARALIRSAYASGRNGVVIADRLIRPVMERIGHGWFVGALDVYQEHEATQIVASALLELIGQATRPQGKSSPLALGATPEGDPFVLPGLLGELVLREGGWEVRNLGVSLPLSSLASAVREHRPRLVFLSVNHLENEENFIHEYMTFYKTAADCGVAVILGGRALVPEIRARLVFASFGDRMAHLAEFARRLLPVADSAAD